MDNGMETRLRDIKSWLVKTKLSQTGLHCSLDWVRASLSYITMIYDLNFHFHTFHPICRMTCHKLECTVNNL